MDAPAGVGYSYSNTPSDYNTNDNKTADDNYAFLQLWMQRYPQYSVRCHPLADSYCLASRFTPRRLQSRPRVSRPRG